MSGAHVFLTLCLLFGMAGTVRAAGRVFVDGWEDGTTNKWAAQSATDRCPVVTTPLDGGPGPFAGTRMLRCNWNGTVPLSNPANFEGLKLTTWPYTSEFLIRFWVRVDLSDFAGGTGPKHFRFGEGASGQLTGASYGVIQTEDGGMRFAVFGTAGNRNHVFRSRQSP